MDDQYALQAYDASNTGALGVHDKTQIRSRRRILDDSSWTNAKTENDSALDPEFLETATETNNNSATAEKEPGCLSSEVSGSVTR